MAELHLQAGDDHVARLAHENDPVRAIVELLWNAIDAEATEVVVALDRDELGAITKTMVTGSAWTRSRQHSDESVALGSSLQPKPRMASEVFMANLARAGYVPLPSDAASHG